MARLVWASVASAAATSGAGLATYGGSCNDVGTGRPYVCCRGKADGGTRIVPDGGGPKEEGGTKAFGAGKLDGVGKLLKEAVANEDCGCCIGVNALLDTGVGDVGL